MGGDGDGVGGGLVDDDGVGLIGADDGENAAAETGGDPGGGEGAAFERFDLEPAVWPERFRHRSPPCRGRPRGVRPHGPPAPDNWDMTGPLALAPPIALG